MGEVHRDSFPAGQYFLAVAGLAAMRRILSRPSEGRPRVEEMRAVLEAWDQFPNDLEVEVVEHDVHDGYERWAPVYDGPNPAIEAEEPIVRAMIEAELARTGGTPGVAVDAGCGTARHAAFLAGLGYEAIGVDATPAMLEVARRAHPHLELREGRLDALPVDDGEADLAVAALTVCHAANLRPVLAELARVVRPGGTVIVSDPHPTMVQLGGVAGFRDRDGDPAEGFTLPFVPNLHHPMHTYVDAALAAGLEIVECQEPTFTEPALAANPAHAILPDAVRQAFLGLPFVVVWRFRKRA
jgi:SAM-dependent methyltransferase